MLLTDTTTSEDIMAVTRKELEALSGKQLKKLLDDVQALQQEKRTERIQELREKWKAEADEEGLSITDIIGVRIEPRSKHKGDGSRTPAKKKYRLPDGSEWSGKGRIPLVLRDTLRGSDGYSAEDGSFDSKDARNKALEKYLL